MKKCLLFVSVFALQQLAAQELKQLTLERSYELAKENYPALKQKDLVSQSADLSIENLRKNFLPQLVISGQASYQSEVTKVDIPLPGFTVPSPAKDQYKLLADVSQVVYDGGVTKEQQTTQRLNAAVEDQKIEVELYHLKERVSQLYLGILYLDEQLKQVDLVKADIQTGITRVEVQVENGVAFKSNLNMLKAELLKAGQRAIEVRASKKGLTDALSVYLGHTLTADIQLEKPITVITKDAETVTRPELKLYDQQSKLVDQQDRLIDAKNLPRASLFAQGGYGRPGLNLLKNDFDFYYIGGIRLNWSLGGLYTRKKEKALVEINKKIVGIQEQTFLLNTISQLKQQQSEIDKLTQLIESDKEIINLRAGVKEAAKAQLENGVITANDYLDEINAEDQARQTMITHQLQLLQAQITYQTISGKQ